ncbi:MAG: beta strand repeat-containing protein, partial [Prosthecobacter sp.]
AGTLPAGLTLNSTSGVSSGTPTTSNSAGTSITITATDSLGCTGSRPLTLKICPVVALGTITTTGTVGTAYTQTTTASGGATPYTYAVTTGTLPGGLTLNASTGVISGTPNVEISSTVTITATDANGCPGTRSYTLAMSCPPITVNPASVPVGLVGSAYTSTTFSATGGTAPYQYTVVAGTLPAGLTLTTAGVLSGTPTASNGAGVSITVQARDAFNCLGTRAYTIKICPVISLNPASFVTPLVGRPYSDTVTAAGGATPYVYAIVSGSLPAGLSLNTSTGVISGAATSTTAATFTLQATDANACTGTRAYTLTPASADFGDYPPFAAAAQAISSGIYIHHGATAVATDGETAPPTAGTATADDTTGSDDENLNIPVVLTGLSPTAQPRFVIPVTLTGVSNGRIGVWIDWNGDTDVLDTNETVTLSTANLVSGANSITATLNPPAGTTTGTKYLRVRVTEGTTVPTFSGESPLRGEVEDHPVVVSDQIVMYAMNLKENSGLMAANSPVPWNYRSATCITPQNLQLFNTNNGIGTSDDQYGEGPLYPNVVVSGGSFGRCTSGWDATFNNALTTARTSLTPVARTAPFTLTFGGMDAGTAITGFTLDVTREATTSPLNAQIFLTWHDGTAFRTARTAAVSLENILSPFSPPTPVSNWQSLHFPGFTQGDPLPTGTALSSETFLCEVYFWGGSGGRLEVDNFSLLGTTVCAVNDMGDWAHATNAAGAATTTTTSIANSNLRLGASVDVEAVVTAGASANADDLTNTGSADDEDGVTVPASITQNASATVSASVFNNSGAPAYLNAWIDFNNDGVFNDTLLSSGGERLEAARAIATGASATTQNITFTVPLVSSPGAGRGVRVRLTNQAVTGPTGAVGTGEIEDYIVSITCPTITLTAPPLAAATVGTAYSQSITAAGGRAPYTYAVTTGTLPAGLSLNTSTGAITGTPANTTSQTFTITATDANACTGARSYTIAPVCPTITLTPIILLNGTVGVAYSQTLTAAGGTAPYSFTLTSGTLPAGLTLSAGGVLSGTPTAANGAGTPLTFRVTDAYGCTGTRSMTLKICPVVTLASLSTSATVGGAYSSSVAASGGVAPYVYAVTSGTLPVGLSLNTTTGAVTGTPTSTATRTFTIT